MLGGLEGSLFEGVVGDALGEEMEDCVLVIRTYFPFCSVMQPVNMTSLLLRLLSWLGELVSGFCAGGVWANAGAEHASITAPNNARFLIRFTLSCLNKGCVTGR